MTLCPMLPVFVDPVTGRRVRQLTDNPAGASIGYFRSPKMAHDGRLLIWYRHDQGGLALLEPGSGEITPLAVPGSYTVVRVCRHEPTIWFTDTATHRSVYRYDIETSTIHHVLDVPADLKGQIGDISHDGSQVCVRRKEQDANFTIPVVKDAPSLWAYLRRPRRSWLSAVDARTGQWTLLATTQDVGIDHIEFHPTDPTLIRYCEDVYEAHGQRMWSVRTDGSQRRPLRLQEFGELITHEFWWGADGKHIGYTYMDRRGDDTIDALPWGEYAPRPCRLGICDLDGNEVFLSGDLGCWHSHLYMSMDGQWVCGEGTDGASQIKAARFAWDKPELNFQPLTDIGTLWVPTRGQGVNANFSLDSRWLIYNNEVNGKKQVFAAEVG